MVCHIQAITIKKHETTTRNAMKKTCCAKKTARLGNLRTRRRRIIYKIRLSFYTGQPLFFAEKTPTSKRSVGGG